MNALELRRRTLGKGVYKKTVEGNPAIAQGSLARRYPGITMQGWTEQESTTGKNLFGGTLEVGWWNVRTGLKEVGSPENRYRCDDYIEIDVTQEYVISSVAYDSINFWVLFYDESKTYLNVYNHLETIPEGARYITFYCVGKDASNKLDDKVQLERGKVATSYEPYTGGQPSPSPDYPQEIKNSCDMGWFDGLWKQGVYSVNDGEYIVTSDGICCVNPISAKAGDKVKLEYKSDNYRMVLLAYDSNGAYISSYGPVISGETALIWDSLPENTSYVRFNIQLFSAGTITPSNAAHTCVTINDKYMVKIDLTGKNMIPSYSELSDWKSSNYMWISVDGFIIGETYTFSQSVVPNLGEGFYVGLGSVAGEGNKGVMRWLYHNSAPNLCMESETFVATQETYYLKVSGIYNQSALTKFLGLFPELMVELGTRKTEYESYKAQTVTLTSDRPLTKWDKLEKRNGVWGWVYKSNEVVLDGSADESWEKYSDIGFRIVLGEMKSGTSLDGFCTRFENVKDNIFDKTGIRFGVNNNVMYINTSTITVELQDFKLLLQSNPIKVLFETETSEFVPLSSEEQEAMNALHTFRPTTVLSNDCDCNMELTYKTKKSLQSVPGGGYKEV